MSCIFEVGEDTVWSPALRVGDLYVRYLREIADMLGVPTGLTAVASDMYEIDVDAYGSLVRKIADLYFSSGHLVLRGLIGGMLGPSVVVLERAGRPLSPQSDEEREFIARARQLSMAR
jgi:hypothetical protein